MSKIVFDCVPSSVLIRRIYYANGLFSVFGKNYNTNKRIRKYLFFLIELLIVQGYFTLKNPK